MPLKVTAYAAKAAKADLEPFEYELPDLPPDRVDVKVESCGICHSDLSMIDNDWGMSQYPLVPGHEVVGTVVGVGSAVTMLQAGDRVGIGWNSGSCLGCHPCKRGDQNLCAKAEGTIVGRHGGFASHVRAQAEWAVKLPAGVDPLKAGPLFCGGITVFNPILQAGVLPTHRVGVVGIGGLGHMAVQFLNKWGCEVTAFSSSSGKADEAKRLGAHKIVSSRSDDELKAIAGTLDFILVTVNVPLNWPLMIAALAPRGRLHFVGAVLEPVPAEVFPLIMGQKSIGGSPLGSPATAETMLEFCGRHGIAPVTETFPMADVNTALKHVRDGKARYRVVLKA